MIQDLRFAIRMIRQHPWFSAAIIGNGSVPMSTGWSRTSVEVPGRPRSEDPEDSADVKGISADYFKTVRVKLVAGREFTDADSGPGAEPVIILNTVAVDRYFKGRNPIGETVKSNGTRKIVGVVTRPACVSGERRSYFSRFSQGTPSSQLYHFW